MDLNIRMPFQLWPLQVCPPLVLIFPCITWNNKDKHLCRAYPECYLHFGVYHNTSWKNREVIETFFLTSLRFIYIVLNHEAPGDIMKYPEGYWNSFDLLWSIMINCDISQSTMGKSFRVSLKIMICHDLHRNISERHGPDLRLATVPRGVLGQAPGLSKNFQVGVCVTMHRRLRLILPAPKTCPY